MGTFHQVFSLAIAAALAAGCGVKKEVHQRALDRLTACEGELGKTRGERDKLTTQLSDLEKETDARIADLLGNKEGIEQELAALRKQRQATEKRLAAFRALRDKLRQLVDTGKLEVAFRNGQMVLKMPSEILFPSGKAKLTPDGEAALKEVIVILLEFKDRRFAIAGHTDNVPIRTRRFKNNWFLSTARALSVLEFFIETGFPSDKLSAAGFGEFDPVAPNDTSENKKKNRRIEIILVPDLSELPTLT